MGVSESSVRRWVDAGKVKLSRTTGGHRRIPVAEAVRFVRELRLTPVRPDLLGLGEVASISPIGGGDARAEEERLYQALAEGDRGLARGIMLSWYLDGRSLAALFDGPLRGAMQRLGELWMHREEGILTEHRASEIVAEAVSSLRAALRPPAADAPVALGGAPSGEFYLIPSLLASVVLAEAGFRDINYGPNTPPRLLATAAEETDARLVWVSISTIPVARDDAPAAGGGQRESALSRDLRDLARRLRSRGATLVLGGRHAREYIPRQQENVIEMQTMAELSAFAAGLVARTSQG